MKKFLPTFAALTLLGTVQVARAADDSGDNAVERGAKSTGHAIKEGAEATGGAIKSGAEATGHAIKKGAEATTDALGITKSDQERYEANARGEHRFTGKVTGIDHDTGLVTLASAGNTLNLHFPKDSLKNVKTGDQLTVEAAYAMSDAEKPSGTQAHRKPAGDQPLHGDHWMTGTVTSVNASTGLITVKTDDAPLTVQFPPASVRDLKEGDKIALELAFFPGAHSTHSRHTKQ